MSSREKPPIEKTLKIKNDIINYCKNSKECFFLLQTDRAGDTVDNGMGLEFELSKFALLGSEKIYDKFALNDDVNFFLIDGVTNLQNFIIELGSMDGYTIIWKSDKEKFKDILTAVDAIQKEKSANPKKQAN